jgi:hypothetical protein
MVINAWLKNVILTQRGAASHKSGQSCTYRLPTSYWCSQRRSSRAAQGDVGHARGDLSASPSELSPPPVAPSSLLKPSSSSSFTSTNREWAQSSTPQLPRSKTYQGFSSTVLHIGPISIGDDRLPCELLLFALSEAHFKIANILGMWNASGILTDSPIGRLRKCVLHGFKV